MSRAKGFRFKSEKNARGKARYTVPTVPARDLDERDVARLTEEQYAAVRDTKTPDGKLVYEPIKAKEENEVAPAKSDGGKSADKPAEKES